MGDLSNNFSRWEWDCFCGCGEDTVDFELIHVLEDLKEHCGGARVNITPKGGFRCRNLNRQAGGSTDSQHLRGRAADIMVDGFSPQLVHRYLVSVYPEKYGIGLYSTFVHIDTRTNGPARWGIKNDLLS